MNFQTCTHTLRLIGRALLIPFLLLLFSQAMAQAPTVASLTATGTNLKWYLTPTGGTALSTSTPLVNGTHYYASQTVNGVESLTRLDVVASFVIPATPTAGTHVLNKTQITWTWNTVASATGYKWSATNNYATATDMLTATTKLETGLTCETAYTRYVWAYDACGNSSALTLTATAPCWVCGDDFTKNHVTTGGVAPVDKSVTYGTVTNIAGETSKCWITRNLGAGTQASSATDDTEASAGWYWQFNRKQGYKCDGEAVRTPSTAWNTPGDLTLTWQAENDPCTLELGSTWRVPTATEYLNIDASGSWNNYNDTYASPLKLHPAGYMNQNGDYLWDRGAAGWYISGTNYNTTSYNCYFLYFTSTVSFRGQSLNYCAASVRCVK